MFERCDFILGAGDSIIIVVPKQLPRAETYTVSVCDENIKFRAGYDDIASVDYNDREVFKRIINNTQIGLVEFEGDDFPPSITQVAYVEVRRAMS